MANMSAIFEYLGANAEQLPLLWLAAPLTGLFVQPVIGYLSDRTWGPLGRRRPYFLVGAILSSLALVVMPNVSALWMAAVLLWVLDASVNISMEPFRAFLGDLLSVSQRAQGFAMQSFFSGVGAVIAAALPWLLNHTPWISSFSFGFPPSPDPTIPLTVKISFYLGAFVFLATVIWTVVTTQEHPPAEVPSPQTQTPSQTGFSHFVEELLQAIGKMPRAMRQLAGVQFFTWLGMFCFFLYFPPAVARNVFGATDEGSLLYQQGIEWAGLCIAAYNGVCFLFAFLLPKLARRTSNKFAHTVGLVCGGVSLISLWFVQTPVLLFLPMIGMGIAWASILAMPYAILMGEIPPHRFGVYTGLFNFFIVIPQVTVALGLGWMMGQFFHQDRLLAVTLGGVLMLVAALWMQTLDDGGAIGLEGMELEGMGLETMSLESVGLEANALDCPGNE